MNLLVVGLIMVFLIILISCIVYLFFLNPTLIGDLISSAKETATTVKTTTTVKINGNMRPPPPPE